MLVGNTNGETFGAAWVGGRLGLRNGPERVEDDAIVLDGAFCACFEMSFRGRRWTEEFIPILCAVLCDDELIIFGTGVFLLCARIGVNNVVRGGRIMEVGGPMAEATAAVGLGIGLLIDRSAA